MDWEELSLPIQKHIQEILGYLNFSSGKRDPKFLRSVNEVFGWLAENSRHPSKGPGRRTGRSAKGSSLPGSEEPTWRRLGQCLQQMLPRWAKENEAFGDVRQAETVLRLVFEEILPAYRRWHEDLLFHQTEESLFQPLFVGRVCEAVLAEGPPWEQVERIVGGVLKRLNDFIGYRPVAVLRTGQQMQPYAHEWVCPIPLYLAGVGVAHGQYHDLVEKALEILAQTDPSILEEAGFERELLDELAVDPRPYDFDHPVNRRPNYLFGTWDLHHLDEEGRYRRYVIPHITLEAIGARLKEAKPSQREEYLQEAAIVLAGIILMGSGITGCRPSSHDSSVSLMTLLPRIAEYRDRFYQDWLKRIAGKHGERLRREAQHKKQPFAGVRHHLNQHLTRIRASQLQHVGVAHILAALGDFQEAREQIRVIPGAAARMKCEIQCCLISASLAIPKGNLESALQTLYQLEDLLHRAIECGALIDPWNILGFSAQFPLFTAVENSVHDHRADELIALMTRLFDLGAQLAKEAAATGREEVLRSSLEWLAHLADWWDQFATTEVSDVRSFSGRDAWQSVVQVCEALRAWYAAGTAAGNIAFWRDRVSQFRTAKAYTMVVDTLLEHKDLVAAMALLVHWISQAEHIPLTEGPYSFHTLALGWMYRLWHTEEIPVEEKWKLARKFLDYLDANAGPLAQPYPWQLGRSQNRRPGDGSEEDLWEESEQWVENEQPETEDLFAAAYEGVTYRDSAQDGFEGTMREWTPSDTDFELVAEADHMLKHVAFWNTIGWLSKYTVCSSAAQVSDPQKKEVIAEWMDRLGQFQKYLQELLREVFHYEIPTPRANWDSMTEYDRRREIKDNLLERLLMGAVELAEAQWFLLACLDTSDLPPSLSEWEKAAVELFRAAFRQELDRIPSCWSKLAVALLPETLLYIPISRGGHPARILKAQKILCLLRRLAVLFPHLGQIQLTLELISLVLEMESRHPVGPGAVTEFDRFFQTALEAIAQCLIHSAKEWSLPSTESVVFSPESQKDIRLFEGLQMIGRPLIGWWLQHTRAIRLSAAEILSDPKVFNEIREFIQQFGAEWFTQEFMVFGNLRAILFQGVDRYLESLEEAEQDDRAGLLQAFSTPQQRQHAIRCLEIILETVVEHYSQYIDYNSTTTQSDRGEMLYMLLDFIRLLAFHQRIEWTLRPFVAVHEVLLRHECWPVAQRWESSILREAEPIAEENLQRYKELTEEYGMHLATIGDHLAERFQGPFLTNRLITLLQLAWQEVRSEKPSHYLPQLKSELLPLADQPSGSGWEPPDWLQTLQEEFLNLQTPRRKELESFELPLQLPRISISYEDLQRQIQQWL